MTSTTQDTHWMHRALALARRGIGLASPNPAVGCVIIDSNGELIGEGWHEYDLLDHAEVAAIKVARQNNKEDRLRGATAYVTLEPCNHTGRTGPCTRALIAAGISRVVAATADPNPTVAGHGMQTLRNAGVQTTLGVCEPEARSLNEGFAKWIQHERPFVYMKIAMSLDGRIAPPPALREPRQPFWITSEESRAAVLQLRHQSDAVLTGIDTVLADDPLLTDRTGQRRRRPLLRVILDSALRMPLDAKIVQSAQDDLVIFTCSTDESKANELRARRVRIHSLPAQSGRVPLIAVLDQLGSEGILTLLTEAGTRLNTALLTGNLADRIHFFVSSQVIGSQAIPSFDSLPSAIHLQQLEIARYNGDVSLCSLLRDPWKTPE